MSLLDEPIDFPSTQELLSVPVLAGAGFGLFAAYSVFKTPSFAQMLGLSMLGGLGGFYLNPVLVSGPPAPRTPNPAPSPVPTVPTIRVPSLPTLDFGGFFQGALDTVQDAIENVLPPTTADTGGKPVTLAPGSIMNPETALALIKQGKYQTHVRFAKMSRYYNWGDFFLNRTSSEIKNESALSYLANGAKHAKNLDDICAIVGKKILIASWWRPPSANAKAGGAPTSFHLRGTATDFNGAAYGANGESFLKNTVMPLALRHRGILEVGPAAPGHAGLHVASWDLNPGDMKKYFIDDIAWNGGVYGFQPKPLGANPFGQYWTQRATPAPAKTSTKTSILPKAGSIAVPAAPKPRPLPFIPIPIFAPAPAPPAYGPGDVSGSIIRYN